MALCIAAGDRAHALGICCVAVGDDCRSVGAYQVSVSDKLTLPTGYTSAMYAQFLLQVRTNMEVYDAIGNQGYGPKEFAEKARKALTPLIQKIEDVIKELQVEEQSKVAQEEKAPQPSV